MKKIYFLSLLLACLMAGSLKSQDFRPVTITHLSGKTESGRIRYGYWGFGNTPQVVKFISANGELKTFNANGLLAFEVTRRDGKVERYAQKIAWINRSPDELRDLEFTPVPKMVRDTVFMLSMLESNAMRLFSYGERKRQLYFLETDTLTALVFKRYLTNTGGADKMRYNANYQRQLLMLLADQPDLRDQILKLPYREKDILSVVETYLASKKLPIGYKYAREKSRPGYYVLGGATLASLEFLTTPSFTHKLQSLNPSYHSLMPSLGGGITYPVPKTNGKLNMVAEIGARAYRWKKTERVTITDEAYDINSYTMRFAHARLSTLLRWNILNKKGHVSASFGINNSMLLYKKSGEISTRFNNGVQSGGTISVPLILFNTYEVGWLAGIGYRKGSWGIDLRFDKSSGISNSDNLDAPVQTISLMALYYFAH